MWLLNKVVQNVPVVLKSLTCAFSASVACAKSFVEYLLFGVKKDDPVVSGKIRLFFKKSYKLRSGPLNLFMFATMLEKSDVGYFFQTNQKSQ